MMDDPFAGLRIPDWQKDALCAEYPDVDWFPERGTSNADARAICGRCLVADECLAFALDAPERVSHGIWGGTIPSERKALTKRAA